jgi:hypothetical protein
MSAYSHQQHGANATTGTAVARDVEVIEEIPLLLLREPASISGCLLGGIQRELVTFYVYDLTVEDV